MRYQQLRILAFMIGALVHLSETADFECNTDNVDANGNPVLECLGSIHGEDFPFDTTEGCTQAGFYCATVDTSNSYDWIISVLNYGLCDSYSCTPPVCTLDCYTFTDQYGEPACTASGC
jgi:hypothetical protein